MPKQRRHGALRFPLALTFAAALLPWIEAPRALASSCDAPPIRLGAPMIEHVSGPTDTAAAQDAFWCGDDAFIGFNDGISVERYLLYFSCYQPELRTFTEFLLEPPEPP